MTVAHPWATNASRRTARCGATGENWRRAVFKADADEREILLAADPDTFFLHPHYTPHNLILARPGRIDPDWAKARLLRQWRDAAPKKWLKAWDAAQGGT